MNFAKNLKIQIKPKLKVKGCLLSVMSFFVIWFRHTDELRLKLASLTSDNRQLENELSEFTAEQARQLTSSSQLRRNHQASINQLDDEHNIHINKINKGLILL